MERPLPLLFMVYISFINKILKTEKNMNSEVKSPVTYFYLFMLF